MSADLSGYKKPRKGGKNKRRKDGEEGLSGSDGEDELRDQNPGRIYFDELFKTVIQDIKDDLTKKDSRAAGYSRKCSITHAHCVLYQCGCGNAKAMKATTGNVTMAMAFTKDHNDDTVLDMPGPTMIEARGQYYKFLEENHPEISVKFTKEDCATEEEKADTVFQAAYVTWKSRKDDKSATAVVKEKKHKKKPRNPPASGADMSEKTESESENVDTSLPIQTTGSQILGVVGLNNQDVYVPNQCAAGGSQAPIPKSVKEEMFDSDDDELQSVPQKSILKNPDARAATRFENKNSKQAPPVAEHGKSAYKETDTGVIVIDD
jgi:hypothetical protein